MEQRTLLLVLAAIVIVSILGLYLIVKWISRSLGLAKGKERVTRFVTPGDADQAENSGKRVIGNFRYRHELARNLRIES